MGACWKPSAARGHEVVLVCGGATCEKIRLNSIEFKKFDSLDSNIEVKVNLPCIEVDSLESTRWIRSRDPIRFGCDCMESQHLDIKTRHVDKTWNLDKTSRYKDIIRFQR